MFAKSSSSMTFLSVFVLTLSGFSNFAIARKYSKCEFVHLLQRHGVDDYQIPAFTCIAMHESGFNTKKADWKNGKFGIFQISDDKWCTSPRRYSQNYCGISCIELMNGHIIDTIACVLKMYQAAYNLGTNGYDMWPSYYPYCAEVDFEYTDECDPVTTEDTVTELFLQDN